MRNTHHVTDVLKAALTVLVALIVALRVVAQPVILAAPEPGVMALCSGGKIVYVSIETGQPVETGDHGAPAADPCPFFGVTAFDLTTKTMVQERPESVATRIVTPRRNEGPVLSVPHQNAARAPPSQA